jgi:hypothetical protein
MVERYASNGCEKSMYAISEGKWVRYSDYAALEAENTRLKEALRGCLNSLCEYVDVDSPGKMSDRKGRGQKAVARACEVLGDA